MKRVQTSTVATCDKASVEPLQPYGGVGTAVRRGLGRLLDNGYPVGKTPAVCVALAKTVHSAWSRPSPQPPFSLWAAIPLLFSVTMTCDMPAAVLLCRYSTRSISESTFSPAASGEHSSPCDWADDRTSARMTGEERRGRKGAAIESLTGQDGAAVLVNTTTAIPSFSQCGRASLSG